MITFDFFFLCCIVKKFLTEYTPQGESLPVRNIQMIATRYLFSGFFIDFILWLPFNFIGEALGEKQRSRDLLFIKLFRLYPALQSFDTFALRQWMIKANIRLNQERISQDPSIGEDQVNDDNRITGFIIIGHAMSTFKLIM